MAARRANTQDSQLIRRGVWVRRRRDGSSPQFGSARSKARARRQRSRYRRWLGTRGWPSHQSAAGHAASRSV